MQVIRAPEFENWLSSESAKVQALVESRVFRIEHYDHLGDAKHLGDGLCELRWKNGFRVYFARVGQRVVLLIHGGGKNAQKSDIKKARALLERYSDSATKGGGGNSQDEQCQAIAGSGARFSCILAVPYRQRY